MAGGIRLTRTTLVLNSANLYAEGGDVKQWCNTITREMRSAAKAFAPPRRSAARPQWRSLRKAQSLGILQASIFGNTTRIGVHEISCTIGARAPHAKYVLNGTGHGGQRYIYTHLGWANKAEVDRWAERVQPGLHFEGTRGLVMWLPPAPGQAGPHLRVHGQKANPFLSDAYTLVARRHTALPARRFRRTLT